eukprot:CAMPEP_0119354918 /NCGR_PEP_ID=MMETSP1334-20130426/3889_1 /TAXON_ID=127549 /ORGANISM="Calcidiscus leptoporus, Strain RCC1130" /LENGTH=333 /DNA_ID=CAMNT_0007368631 /DNA_START=158 /DNA_END=1159 /DNA_ORIENTATION=+
MDWGDHVECPELGDGWSRMSKPRPDGAAGSKVIDHVYISPSGKRFRSLKAAREAPTAGLSRKPHGSPAPPPPPPAPPPPKMKANLKGKKATIKALKKQVGESAAASTLRASRSSSPTFPKLTTSRQLQNAAASPPPPPPPPRAIKTEKHNRKRKQQPEAESDPDAARAAAPPLHVRAASPAQSIDTVAAIEHGAQHLLHVEPQGGAMGWGAPAEVERSVRYFKDGSVRYYRGEPPCDRLVRAELEDGSVQYYEGAKGFEHGVRKQFADGRMQFFVGDKGSERTLRLELPDGRIQFYEGEQGAERVTRAYFADGRVKHYEGHKGAERVVRIEFP